MVIRYRIDIQGIVQGVGFRPFVYKLARSFGIKGWVHNHSFGVTIEAEGHAETLKAFIKSLTENPPVLAQIIEISVKEIPVCKEDDFVIKESQVHSGQFTLISPDISTCNECFSELIDESDRRYRYPFTNCTNCGPRFTIIKDIPYDRPNTTMAQFKMCPECQAEYENPLDRRFHAQPNACPVCGPELRLVDNNGKEFSGDPIKRTIQLLADGKIVAIKGLGGFHLAVDATQEKAVQRLRCRKNRYEKPLAIMSDSVETIRKFAEINELEKQILESPRRPICLLRKKIPSPIAPSVSPDNDYLGLMLPYTPLHFLILHEGEFLALVMTSGNISEEPIIFQNDVALHRLGNVADFFLMHNRDIYQPVDDSVVRLICNGISYIRRSRGFVPLPVLVKNNYPSVLAVGGELKNTVCLNKDHFFFLSQHIGDLENLETLEFFERSIKHLKKILEIQPVAIAHDLHPDYLSTHWANEQNDLPAFAIQHHHAHIAACMAEREMKGKVIGFSLDGTGFGTDGTIWGGEVLLCDEVNFQRLAYFRQVPLPGGDKAIKEPWRMALAYGHASGINFPVDEFFPNVSSAEFELVSKMIQKNINSPLTSSCGRLFDAVAALCGLRNRVGYEGQAAMQLEALLDRLHQPPSQIYHFEIQIKDDLHIIDWQPVIQKVVMDVRKNVPRTEISWKFHMGLVDVFKRLALNFRKMHGIERIVLSGGCFQNRFLTEKLVEKLIEEGFKVYYHKFVPPNDGGLSLGQAYILVNQLKEGLI